MESSSGTKAFLRTYKGILTVVIVISVLILAILESLYHIHNLGMKILKKLGQKKE